MYKKNKYGVVNFFYSIFITVINHSRQNEGFIQFTIKLLK